MLSLRSLTTSVSSCLGLSRHVFLVAGRDGLTPQLPYAHMFEQHLLGVTVNIGLNDYPVRVVLFTCRF